LDANIRRRIWALIKKIQQDGVTIFLTTHYIEEAEFLAQRLAFLLNSFVFSSLAVGLAMLVKSHADQAMMTSFIITPRAFLGGTFFPIEHLPGWTQKILILLPLTHTAHAIRASAFGAMPALSDYLILVGIGISAFVFAIMTVNKARD
jgi:ABC-type polysaccharide/polyol phosphate export permease